MIRKIYT